MIDKIQKTREYLDYLEQHYNNVQLAWVILQEKCYDMSFITDDTIFWSIDSNIKKHDDSKLSAEELTQYRRHFFPTENEDKDKKEFFAAWHNHLKENMHHWQTWTTLDFGDDKSALVYFVENICDWMAMGFEKGDSAKEYFENNRDKIDLPNWAITLMYEIFARLY